MIRRGPSIRTRRVIVVIAAIVALSCMFCPKIEIGFPILTVETSRPPRENGSARARSRVQQPLVSRSNEGTSKSRLARSPESERRLGDPRIVTQPVVLRSDELGTPIPDSAESRIRASTSNHLGIARNSTAAVPALPPDVQTSIPATLSASAPATSSDSSVMLYELQLGRLARRVIKVLEHDGDVLVPLSAFLELAEIEHRVGATGATITGHVRTTGQRFAFAAEEQRAPVATMDKRPIRFAARELRLVGGTLHVSLRMLERTFQLSAAIDRETSAIFVYNPEQLPVADRLRREMARAILLDGPIARPTAVRLGTSGPWSANGVVFTYDVRTASDQWSAATEYDFSAASGLARGTMTVRLRGAGETAPELGGAWIGRWPLNRWLTQLQIGDGVSAGPRPALSRGVAITNAPFVRPLLVEDMPFSGSLPPDWSVEAYRAGRLVGFDSVDGSGRYELTLPVNYGENPIDLVAYGPRGEIRTFDRTFRVLPSMLPPGVFEYGASLGMCRSPAADCSFTGNLDLRYGLSRRWTARAGVDRHPYAVFTGAPVNAVVIEVEAARMLSRAAVRFDPSMGFRAAADYVRLGSANYQWSIDGRFIPSPRTMKVAAEVEARRIRTPLVGRTDARVGVALRAAQLMARPYVRLEHIDNLPSGGRHHFAGVDATVLPQRRLGPVLGTMWAQGKVELESMRRLGNAAFTLSRSFGSAVRLEAGARWQRDVPGMTLTFSLVSQLAAARATSVLTASSADDRARLEQNVGGSVVWSRGAAIALSSEPALDRGGIAGRVFLDVDGNGRRESDEPAVPGARVLVGNRMLTTDAEGRYRVWGLSPFEEIVVAVDTLSLPSPWWLPAFDAATVLPPPNAYGTADIPLQIGGIIEGNIVAMDDVSVPSEPLTLLLIDIASGKSMTIETFGDGSFYRMGIPPGDYFITLDSTTQSRLSLAADTTRFTLPPLDVGRWPSSPDARRQAALNASGASVSGLRIGVRRRVDVIGQGSECGSQ